MLYEVITLGTCLPQAVGNKGTGDFGTRVEETFPCHPFSQQLFDQPFCLVNFWHQIGPQATLFDRLGGFRTYCHQLYPGEAAHIQSVGRNAFEEGIDIV